MFGLRKSKKIKNSRIERESREIFPQEILLDSLAQRKKFFGRKKFEVPLCPRMFYIFSLMFAALLLLLAGRSFWFQIVKGKEFLELAKDNYERVYYGPTDRGVIYDQNLEQLVFNDTSFELVCYKKDLPAEKGELDKTLERAAQLLGSEMSLEKLQFKIEEADSDQVLIKQSLSHEEVVLFRSSTKTIPGFYLKENIVRNYVSGPYFSHVIGYLARAEDSDLFSDYSPLDFAGYAGLEKEYEQVLRGQKEKVVVQKNVLSEELSRRKVSDAEPGNSLVLWIDGGLQKKSTDSLQSVINRFGAEGGAVVAMDPQTGGVLSLVSLPSFDNNIFLQKMSSGDWEKTLESPHYPFWNRAVSGTYATGSIIKTLIASAALEEGVIGPGDIIGCEGRIKIENPWFPEQPFYFHDWTVHGPISIRRAIAESCNVYFYTVGGGHGAIDGLGAEKIKEYLNLFGWGSKTGIDIPAEREGLIPDPSWKKDSFEEASNQVWMPGDTYNLSIGQGYLSVTPIQVTSSFVALANGGKVLSPRLVKEIVDENKGVVEEIPPEVIRENFIDPNHIQVVREGMREAVTYGTGIRLSSLPVTSASKSGTAQTSREEVYNNWVTVFAPYEDPEIVLTVMVENVPKEQGAALDAAREILEWYFGPDSDGAD